MFVQTLRRGLPGPVGSEIRPVRISIGHLVRIEEMIHGVTVALVQRIMQIHPVVDHERLSSRQALGDLRHHFFFERTKSEAPAISSEVQYSPTYEAHAAACTMTGVRRSTAAAITAIECTLKSYIRRPTMYN